MMFDDWLETKWCTCMDVLIPVIDISLCQGCQPCEAQRACRTHAIVRIDLDESPWILYERCNHCARCIPVCNSDAIQLRGREWTF